MTFYRYKLLLGAWGLLVRIDTDVANVPHGEETGNPVSDGVWLRNPPSPGLEAEDLEWLRRGAQMLAPKLRTTDPATSTVITVNSMEIPLVTDYQPEAAAAALLEWAREHLGVHIAYTARFEREQNRYVFTWPAGTDKQAV